MDPRKNLRVISILFLVTPFMLLVASSNSPDDLVRNLPLLWLCLIPIIGYLALRDRIVPPPQR